MKLKYEQSSVIFYNGTIAKIYVGFVNIQKKQKEIQKSREALKTGDKVITAGGIYGKIKEIGDTYMLIEVADGVRIRVDKTSIFASAEDAQQQK